MKRNLAIMAVLNSISLFHPLGALAALTVTTASGTYVNIAQAPQFPVTGTCSPDAISVRAWPGPVTTPCESGTFRLEMNLSTAPDTNELKITLKEINTLGIQSAGVILVLKKDTVPPSVSIRQTSYNPERYLVSLSGSCSESGRTVSAIFGDKAWQVNCDKSEFFMDLDFSYLSPLTRDINISIHQTDLASNPGGVSKTLTDVTGRTLDPPIITNSKDEVIDTNNAANFPLKGKCSEGGSKVIAWPGKATGSCVNGAFNVSMDLSQEAPDSIVKVTAKQLDLRGIQSGGAYISFKKVSNPPEVKITQVLNPYRSNFLTIEGTCSHSGLPVILANQKDSISPCEAGKFSLRFNLSGLPAGQSELRISVVQKDSYGAYGATTVSRKVIVPFKHQGGLEASDQMLTQVRESIAMKIEPYYGAYLFLKSRYKSNYIATPTTDGIVSSDINGSNDHFALAETKDARAAHDLALLGAITGETRYFENSATIISDWVTAFAAFNHGAAAHRGINWVLQASWAAQDFVKGAELLKNHYKDWPITQQNSFKKMLNFVFLPVLHHRILFGNREFSICHALVAIGIFNDDLAAFSEGVNHYRRYLPQYIYLKSDGAIPLTPDYWMQSPSNDELALLDIGVFENVSSSWIFADTNPLNLGDDSTSLLKGDPTRQWKSPLIYVEGYSAETGGRDLNHAEMAFQHIMSIAEMAYHQGIDLFSPFEERLVGFSEIHASLRLGTYMDTAYPNGLNQGNGLSSAAYVKPYFHFAGRMGRKMPMTEKMVTQVTQKMKFTLLDRNQDTGTYPSFIPNEVVPDRIWGQKSDSLTHTIKMAP